MASAFDSSSAFNASGTGIHDGVLHQPVHVVAAGGPLGVLVRPQRADHQVAVPHQRADAFEVSGGCPPRYCCNSSSQKTVPRGRRVLDVEQAGGVGRLHQIPFRYEFVDRLVQGACFAGRGTAHHDDKTPARRQIRGEGDTQLGVENRAPT
jgi:hypothetical protein